jgi:hypothetical protein
MAAARNLERSRGEASPDRFGLTTPAGAMPSTNSATARRIVSEPALGRRFSMTSDMLVRFQNRAN